MFQYTGDPKSIRDIVWFGAYGNTNIGDDLIFFSLRKFIPEKYRIQLSCRFIGTHPEYGVETFNRYNRKDWIKRIKHADMCLLGGGGLFEYYKASLSKAKYSILAYLEPLVYARYFGKPYAIVGVGCNNSKFSNPLLRFIFKRVANSAMFIITRDSKSKNGFIVNGVTNPNLHASYDPVFSLSNIENSKPTIKKKIGFLLWPYYMWPYFHKTQDIVTIKSQMTNQQKYHHDNFVKELSSLFVELRAEGYECVFPMFHFSDKIMLGELGEKEDYQAPNYLSYIESIQSCDIIITMRYHGQITSILNNRPIISITVQEKMEELVKNFVFDDTSVDINNVTKDSLLQIIKHVESEYDSILNKQFATASRIQNSVITTYKNCFNTIDV